MNPTDEASVLAALDWEVRIACVHKNCDNAGSVLVSVNPGPETCLHPNWAPVCQGHEATMRLGHNRCPHCKETYIIAATRPL